MLNKLISALMVIYILSSSLAIAEGVQSAPAPKKDEKPRREAIIDTFTRIDEGAGGADALVIYAHPLYFVYKGMLDSAQKSYDLEKFYVFIVTINSQKKTDLSGFKIEESIFIRTEEGTEYPAVKQWTPIAETPSKRSGVVRFYKVDANGNKVISDKAKSFEIVIKNLENISERVFKWQLPIEF